MRTARSHPRTATPPRSRSLHRWLPTLLLAAGAVLAAGCASFNTLRSEVSTYGSWPADRKPGTYAFDRLPSQETLSNNQRALEDAARGAIERAGFKPAAAGQAPDVLVQIGARISAAQRSPFDDPFYWHPALSHHYRYRSPRAGFYWVPAWDTSLNNQQVDREVAVLLRDRASGKVLYEARASNFGFAAASSTWLPAMYNAALTDFPKASSSSRVVQVPLPE